MKIYLLVLLTVLSVTTAGEFTFELSSKLWSNILLTNAFLKAASLARLPLSVFLDTKLRRAKRRDGRIIGGTNAKEGEFPWMVR